MNTSQMWRLLQELKFGEGYAGTYRDDSGTWYIQFDSLGYVDELKAAGLVDEDTSRAEGIRLPMAIGYMLEDAHRAGAFKVKADIRKALGIGGDYV